MRCLVLILLILCSGCTLYDFLTVETAVQISPSVNEDDVEMNDMIQKELTRMRSLLSEERAKTPLQEIAPIQPPEDIGALAGVGFLAHDPDATASVYVFESGSQHREAVEKLRADIPTEGMRILHATNGRMLFFGYTDTSGENGRTASFRLAGIVSAFAGDE